MRVTPAVLAAAVLALGLAAGGAHAEPAKPPKATKATKAARADKAPPKAGTAATEPTKAPAADSAAAAPAPAPDSPVLDGVVAVVDGDPISLRELKRYGTSGAPFLPANIRNDYRALLDSMIERRLLKSEYEKNGVVAPDAMVDRYIAGVLEESKGTRAALDADIARAGLTWKDYYERMREEVQRIQLVNLLIRSRVNVPEEEVRRVWEEDPQYLESEKLEVAAIFLPSPPFGEDAGKAKELAATVQLEAKKNFEAAARKYSKGLNASDGGHLGEFKRGTMNANFERALTGLGVGEVSAPTDGSDGIYIVKLLKVYPAGRRPFDEVKEALTEKLYEERLGERYQKWVTEDLRKDHHVDIMVDKLALIAAGGAPTYSVSAPALPTTAAAAPSGPASPSAPPASASNADSAPGAAPGTDGAPAK